MVNYDNKDIEWNINQGFGIVLLKLIDDINVAATTDDILWFENMRKLFRNIESIKKVEEIRYEGDIKFVDVIDVKMILASNKLNMQTPISKSGLAVQKSVLKNVKRDLDTINRDLMRLINNSEIIKFHVDWADPKLAMLK